MNVKLISVTKSFPMQGEFREMSLNAEELIVYIARVSNPSNQLNNETSDKLISYLIKNKHWSPFEMVDMTVEIVTSRAIAQQILRHRSFSFQEFSQRYATATEFEDVSIRKQSEKNRQSSTEEFDPIVKITDGVSSHEIQASNVIGLHLQQSENLYKSLIDAGVSKETARFVLPLTTQTKLYMKGSVRSWIHYLQIRCDEHTQLEHQLIAKKIQSTFRTLFPNISKSLGWISI